MKGLVRMLQERGIENDDPDIPVLLEQIDGLQTTVMQWQERAAELKAENEMLRAVAVAGVAYVYQENEGAGPYLELLVAVNAARTAGYLPEEAR